MTVSTKLSNEFSQAMKSKRFRARVNYFLHRFSTIFLYTLFFTIFLYTSFFYNISIYIISLQYFYIHRFLQYFYIHRFSTIFLYKSFFYNISINYIVFLQYFYYKTLLERLWLFSSVKTYRKLKHYCICMQPLSNRMITPI